MIYGTGPGRGVPWWRGGRIWSLWSFNLGDYEVPGRPREGRTVAVIGRRR
jgi:hypothetical protein